MRLFSSSSLVAAYVCPRGTAVIVGKMASAGIEIERALEVPGSIESEFAAADHLNSVLRTAGISRARIAVALRGFGVVHHVLQFPPAKDELLGPIIEREVRRLEPQLSDSIVSWIPLPVLETGGTDAPQQRSVLAAAAPRDVLTTITQRVHGAGHRVSHITVLPAAMQRILEEFDDGAGALALVAALPDGAFLGFALAGGLRLIVEPPLPQGADHESAALAEEVELGAMFVRQQFRGAQVERIAIVGTRESLSDAENVLAERLHVPTKQLGVRALSPAAFAALGALLDSRVPRPLSLGGETLNRAATRTASMIETASLIAVVVLALIGVWTVTEAIGTVRTTRALESARRTIQQDSFGLTSIRATADQRRLVRDARAATRAIAEDRIALQHLLAGIGAAIRPPVRLDTLRLTRDDHGWSASMVGNVRGATTAHAIQALHDAYRELPQRLRLDSLSLDQLVYSDTGRSSAAPVVQFQLSVGIPSTKKE